MSELYNHLRDVLETGVVTGCAYHQRGQCRLVTQAEQRAETAEENYRIALQLVEQTETERDALRAEVERLTEEINRLHIMLQTRPEPAPTITVARPATGTVGRIEP